MSRRSLPNAVLLAAVAVTLAACATTSLQSTWKDPSAAPLNLKGKKVVALVVTDEEALRNAAEDEAAREITAHGGVGVPAYTLLLVPVMYSIFVLDLKLIRWEKEEDAGAAVDRAEVTAGTAAVS